MIRQHGNGMAREVLIQALGFIRMLHLRDSDPSKWDWLLSFMSHLEERNKNKDFREKVDDILDVLSLLEIRNIDTTLVGHLHGIMATNAMHMDPTGQAFFPHLCLASHSCIPSCEHWLLGTTAMVRAKRRIKKGEEVTIRYTYTSLHRDLLRDVINDAWMFSCSCERCSDSTELGTFASSFSCSHCSEGFIKKSEHYSQGDYYNCSTCRKVMTRQEVMDKATTLRKLELSSSDSSSIPDLIHDITKLGGHPLYHSVISLKLQFIEQICSNITEETCSIVQDYCRDISQYLQILNPGVSMQAGRVLFCCSKSRLWILQRAGTEDKIAALKERKEILKMQVMAQKMISGFVK